MDQETAAGEMGVSRPTVTRIYASARKKIAQALAEGKAIHIEGGPISQSNAACPRISGQKGNCHGKRNHNGRCGRMGNIAADKKVETKTGNISQEFDKKDED